MILNKQDGKLWQQTLVINGHHKWGTTKYAKEQKDKITLTRGTQGNLVLNFDLTKGSINPKGTEGCWAFLLWAYVDGKDPSYQLNVCEIENNVTDVKPNVSPLSQEKVITVHRIKDLTRDQTYGIMTAMTGLVNNWLLMVEQAGVAVQPDCIVCLGPRPLMRIIPPLPELTPDCTINLMSRSNPNSRCKNWDKVYPLTKTSTTRPIFSSEVATGNFTYFYNETGATFVGHINPTLCQTNQSLSIWVHRKRADIWWFCGGNILRDVLPKIFEGTCALVSLLMPVNVIKVDEESLSSALQEITPEHLTRRKRELKKPWGDDPTFIDSLGVPDEYKLVDQVASGFENLPIISTIFPVTPNKNVDRINYIHYNVQKLSNYTEDGFKAVHEQLASISLMAFQNRIALNMLLAEKGGVCGMFGEQCCTFIPNNTAPDGSLTRAIEGLRTLNSKMKDHSGVETSMWDGWMDGWASLEGSRDC